MKLLLFLKAELARYRYAETPEGERRFRKILDQITAIEGGTRRKQNKATIPRQAIAASHYDQYAWEHRRQQER